MSKSETNRHPKVSVIIPVHKATRFLDDLLDSMCGQTLRDIETIFVLDGPDEEARRIT